jgi:hypothetical protein
MNDERIVWVRASPGRKIIQTIEAIPTGFSVTTEWVECGELFRRDCEISIREVPGMSGDAAELKG